MPSMSRMFVFRISIDGMMADDEHQHDEAESEDGAVSDDALDAVFDDDFEDEESVEEGEGDERAAFGDDGLDE